MYALNKNIHVTLKKTANIWIMHTHKHITNIFWKVSFFYLGFIHSSIYSHRTHSGQNIHYFTTNMYIDTLIQYIYFFYNKLHNTMLYQIHTHIWIYRHIYSYTTDVWSKFSACKTYIFIKKGSTHRELIYAWRCTQKHHFLMPESEIFLTKVSLIAYNH